MPFTTSHPAIILPLKKLWPRWFSLTGLMAGAMAPDLQYFLLANTTWRGISHSWLGLFVYCLPLGLAFSFAFHWLFKHEVIAHLPRPIAQTLSGLAVSRFAPNTERQWLVLIGSVLVGALSHFFWDSFTHAEGELARRIPWLLEQSTHFGMTRGNTRWVQHVSSLAGALAVLIGVWKGGLLPKPVDNHQRRAKPLGGFAETAEPHGGPALQYLDRKAGQKIVFWLLGSLCGLAFASLAVWFYNGYHDWHLELGYNRNLAFMSFGLGNWAGFFWYVCLYSLIRRRES